MDAYKNNSKHIFDTENDEDSLIYKNIKNALYRDKEKAMKRYNITEDELYMYIIPESINFNLSGK